MSTMNKLLCTPCYVIMKAIGLQLFCNAIITPVNINPGLTNLGWLRMGGIIFSLSHCSHCGGGFSNDSNLDLQKKQWRNWSATWGRLPQTKEETIGSSTKWWKIVSQIVLTRHHPRSASSWGTWWYNGDVGTSDHPSNASRTDMFSRCSNGKSTT